MPKGQGIFLEFLPSKLIAPTPTQPTTTTVFQNVPSSTKAVKSSQDK